MENQPEDPLPSVVQEEEEEGGPVKTFLEHLEDLRWVIIKVLAALLIGMVGCLAGAPAIVDFLQWPLVLGGKTGIKLQNLGPMGPYTISLKIALYGGLTVALPFILYFIGEFVMPALKRNEKKFFLRAFIVCGGLFLLGLIVCYFFVLPITLRATVQYTQWLGLAADFWRAEDYIQFVLLFMVGMGLSFELPVLVLTLVKLGILQYTTLARGRPYFFIITFGIVAFITPDFVSTFFLVLPLLVLLEACIWIAWWWDRQARKAPRP